MTLLKSCYDPTLPSFFAKRWKLVFPVSTCTAQQRAILVEYTPGWHSCTDVQWRHAPLAVGLEPFRHKGMKTCLKELLFPWAGADGYIDWWVCVVPCPLMCNMHELARRNPLCLKTGHLHCASVWDSTVWLDWNSMQMDRQSSASHISSSPINNSRAREQRQPGGTEPLGASDLSATLFIRVTAHHPHQPENTVFTYTWWPQVAAEDNAFTVFNARLILF